jgi:hypothetical protein
MARTKIVIDDQVDGKAKAYVELSTGKGIAHDIGVYLLGKLRGCTDVETTAGEEPPAKVVTQVVERIVKVEVPAKQAPVAVVDEEPIAEKKHLRRK